MPWKEKRTKGRYPKQTDGDRETDEANDRQTDRHILRQTTAWCTATPISLCTHVRTCRSPHVLHDRPMQYAGSAYVGPKVVGLLLLHSCRSLKNQSKPISCSAIIRMFARNQA